MDEKFIESLSDDGLTALKQVCDAFDPLRFEIHRNPKAQAPRPVGAYLEFYGLLRAVSETHGIGLPNYEISGDDHRISEIVVEAFQNARQHALKELSKREAGERVQMLEERFKLSLTKPFAYEFSEDDIERIRISINSLRELISKSEQIDENHRHRLLKRLERLQQELHKKISDLDRFWGLIGDATVVLKKIGENAEPLVKRVREIMEIVWVAQTKAYQLPEGTKFPLLGDGDKGIEQ